MGKSNLLSRTSQRLFSCRSVTLTPRKHNSLWTSDNTVKSPHRDVEIPNRTVPEHIWENMERWADKTAMVCALTNRSYTYHHLYKYSRNFAAKLRTQLKIRDGDVVCIMMPNCPDYPLASLGALEAGAEVTTVNPIYTPYEVERQITQSNPKILIGVAETVPVLKEALFLAKKNLPIITVKEDGGFLPQNTISFHEFALADNVDHSILKEVARKSEDVAFLPYSSGTTGLPNGVELVHRNIVINCVQQDVETVRHYVETTKTNQDVTLGVLPFFHIYGQSIIMWHKLSVGYKIVTLPKFQPDTCIEAMKNHRINLFCAAPPLALWDDIQGSISLTDVGPWMFDYLKISRFLRALKNTLSRLVAAACTPLAVVIVLFLASHSGIKEEHLASVKTITSGAAPLPRNDVCKVLDKVKHNMDFLQIYGLTEVSPLATAMLPGSNEYSKAGYGVSNTELRIADKDLKPLGPNELGELLIRGPQVMKGYRNNPEATRAAITKDGWFRTGDLASIGEDGIVTICDRLKELIKVKGYQVAPAELENVLKEHPDILDAAVLGVPDARMGEVPKAFIVLKDGRNVDAHGVTSFVSERVAPYKRIKEIMFLDALPKNPSGKILKKVLKEKYC